MANFQQCDAVVEWSKEITKKVWVAKFKLVSPSRLDFSAGQYCSFRVQDKLRRTFSIATPPSQKDTFEICADITPMGLGSLWIMNLKPGDHVDFMAPLGKFLLESQNQRPEVFLATGTGIAPIRSMVHETLERQTGEHNTDTYLVWGLRHAEDIFWNEEFETLKNKYPNFKYELTLSQPGDSWQGKKGYVTDHLHMVGDLLKYDYYLCGNHDTIDKIKEKLLSLQIPLEQIKTELFH